MNQNNNLKVLELRNYLLEPQTREKFTVYFSNHFVDSQNKLGGFVLGHFKIKGETDKFFWMRGFSDMRSRLDFLRAFYEKGEVWKKYGAGANKMMLDSDNVYLLKPFGGESYKPEDLAVAANGVVTIEFYFAADDQFDNLADFFQTDLYPILKNKPTLWKSEMTENDFPRLPVIQDKNLLVAITKFSGETDYQKQSEKSAEIKSRLHKFIVRKNALVIYPSKISLNIKAKNQMV